MNKNDLVDHVSETCDITKVNAGKAVESVFGAITSCLQKRGEARLIGFGTFSVYRRTPTTARNPHTGEPITIPAYNQPKFKPGKALKEAVN